MRASDELRQGKANLQRWGWTRGLINLQKDLVGYGSVCAIGALMPASEREELLLGLRPVSTGHVRATHPRPMAYLDRAVQDLAGPVTVWGYNDGTASGRKDIEKLYDLAIELAEADEAAAAVREMIAFAEASANLPTESFDAETKKGVDSPVAV